MKHVLVSDPLIDVKKEDYFNQEKSLYSAVPIFPLLSEEDIAKALTSIVDMPSVKAEIKALKAEGSHTIPDTEYIICLTDWHSYPQLISMLTVIREWAFRKDGGGVGRNDYDDFDKLAITKQLIIINPNAESLIDTIIGGYRYLIHEGASYEQGPMGDHFEFSASFKEGIWSELGRSFINPYYQQRATRQSFDYVLHGLGYIYARNQQIQGYFGKVTLYNIYERQKADTFFTAVAKEYWASSDKMWINPAERLQEGSLTDEQKAMLDRDIFKGMFYLLRKEYQINLVPIMAIYNRMTSLDKMYYFGAFRHDAFGKSTEVGMGISIKDIREVIMDKFVGPYLS